MAHDGGFIIYHGEQPGQVKIDVYGWHGVTGEYLGRMGVDMTYGFDAAGRFQQGYMKVDLEGDVGPVGKREKRTN